MFNTLPFCQTDPAGNPAEEVGILLIERLFTNVVRSLSVAIPEPNIND